VNTSATLSATPAPASTSVGAKLLNLFVCPSVVFEEISAGPGRPANWLVPTALVCLSGLLVLEATTDPERTAASIRQLLDAAKITPEQSAFFTAHWQMISGAATCLGSFVGTFWSAFVLWFIGRVFLKSHFPFTKALEVTALSGTVLVLGMAVTALLALALGNASARPALSLLARNLDAASRVRPLGELFNCFYLWTTVVLAIGLARLSRVTFKEAAFWVFGYWLFARLSLILLAA
jgi:hypothetical protein